MKIEQSSVVISLSSMTKDTLRPVLQHLTTIVVTIVVMALSSYQQQSSFVIIYIMTTVLTTVVIWISYSLLDNFFFIGKNLS